VLSLQYTFSGRLLKAQLRRSKQINLRQLAYSEGWKKFDATTVQRDRQTLEDMPATTGGHADETLEFGALTMWILLANNCTANI